MFGSKMYRHCKFGFQERRGKVPEYSLNGKLESDKIFGDSGRSQLCYHCVIKE